MIHSVLKYLGSHFGNPRGFIGILTTKLINFGNQKLYKTVLDNINMEPENVVLDIGFGNGYFINKILKNKTSINICGIDISKDMVNYASKKNRRFIEKGSLKLSLTNIQETPFEDNKFDRAYTISTVYFWPDLKKCFAEVKRIIKPNGLFLNVIYTKQFLDVLRYTTYGFDKFTVEEMKKITEENGMRVLKVIEIYKNISYCIVSENVK